MKFLKNTIGFLSVFCMVPAVFGVTARPGVINAGNAVMAVSSSGAIRRMPSGARTVSDDKQQHDDASTLLDEIECIDSYMECIQNDDTCGIDFSECTTNVLFHAQMPDCASTLLQCNTKGIYALFGTENTADFAKGAKYNDDNEVIGFTYPTDGSVMGQKIIAARIENMYDNQTCVKRYTNCLKRDDVCGENFELCSSTRSFKKQALNCDSHLARCTMAAVREMFGEKVKSKSMNDVLNEEEGVSVKDLSSVNGSIATMIDEGADYVAANAVSSCYKTVDACITKACTKNPLRCIEGTSVAKLQAAQGIITEKTEAGDGNGTIVPIKADVAGKGIQGEHLTLTTSDINRYLRSECADTVGTLEACHITYNGKKPKKSDLTDTEIVDEVFVMAHNDRKSILESKIQGLLQKFDTDAKNKCRDTFMQCAMRSCGGGSGAVCYSDVFGTDGEQTINGTDTRAEIEKGCAAITNTDPNCLYAYQDVSSGDDVYSYTYADNAFDTLFPAYNATKKSDPIGLVAALNSRLSTTYNDAAIAQMRKDCESVATSCVRSLCGEDYVSCYRNRTDIASTLTKTNNNSFDTSMNKVGGVLDYTIVLGLCGETVKNASSCEEHLAIEKAKIKSNDSEYVKVWGDKKTVHDGWYDAGGANQMEFTDAVQVTDANGKEMCYADNGKMGECGTVDLFRNIYDEPAMQSYDTYVQSQATTSLFRELLVTLEREAQAIYNAKLTEQQNACMAENKGGIMGANDMGATYMWAKLKGNGKVPDNYSVNGLTSGDFMASNDLYGSFCRIKVTVHSDDINILNALNGNLATREFEYVNKASHDRKGVKITPANSSIDADWATRYFAVGDTFVCGSWIPQADLMRIAEAVGKNARTDAEANQTNLRGWMAALGAIGLGTGGAFLGDAIQDGKAFAGLTGNKADQRTKDKGRCNSLLEQAKSAIVDTFDVEGKTADNDAAAAAAAAAAKRAAGDANQKVTETIALLDEYNVTGYQSAQTTFDTALSEYTKLENHSSCKKDAKQCTTDKDVDVDNALNGLKAFCAKIEDSNKCDSNNKGDCWWKNSGGATIGAVAGMALGGGLAYAITNEIQNAELDKAQQAAIAEFMENVGSKIQCYVGPEMVGSYGQAVPTSM